MIKIKLKKKIVITVIICLILVVIHYAGWGRFAERYIAVVFNPLNKASFGVADSLGDFFNFYLNKDDYRTQNEELRKYVVKLAQQNVETAFLREENERLKQELEFVDEYGYKYVTARVMGRNFSDISTNILIDKGADKGISEGLAVTSEQGVIIGKIVEVGQGLSKVRLLTDNQSRLAVAMVSKEGLSLGLGYGEHNINVKIDMIPKDARVEIGDLVATSGLEKGIPQGLVLGNVKEVIFGEEKIWQEAMVEPLVDYEELKIVTVILAE